jgi:hypothetical protein
MRRYRMMACFAVLVVGAVVMAQQKKAVPLPPKPADDGNSMVVITIKGVCPAVPARPANCQTEITREGFESLVKALQQGPNPLSAQQKLRLASMLARMTAMSEAAKVKGLDKSSGFMEEIKFVRMQILQTELQRPMQEEADRVPPETITAYYKENPEAFEQFSLDRLFIPRSKRSETADKTDLEKAEQELNSLAGTLRERAAAGEDFIKLQKEAFEAANMKVDSPTVNLPKVRRTGLPPAHAVVFDLKVGAVSAIISDSGGHYVYKVLSKEVLPLGQVTDEIHNKLKRERLKEMTDKFMSAYQTVINEAYFGSLDSAQGTAIQSGEVVLTVKGVCPAPARPTDCKTEITREEFERLFRALQGTNSLKAQQGRQLANQLPGVLAMSKAAEAKGLENSENFLETMKFVRMRILTTELERAAKEEAGSAEKVQEVMDRYTDSFDAVLNPEYFGPAAEGPSLHATMKFVREKSDVGPVNYVVYSHDNTAGTDSANRNKIEITHLVANADACRIDYHIKIERDGTVITDVDAGILLKDVRDMMVMPLEQQQKEVDTAAGHPEFSYRFDPSVFVLKMNRTDKGANWLYFFDEQMANRVAKAMVHAVELCGGGGKAEPF